MKNRMGTFYTNCKMENHVDRKKSVEIPKLLVDTGSEFTWVLADTLKKAGITKEKKDYTFVMANGQQITRTIGFAIIHVGDAVTIDEVVFAQPGDLELLGARSLEGLNLRVDSRAKKLVAGGPILAAAQKVLKAVGKKPQVMRTLKNILVVVACSLICGCGTTNTNNVQPEAASPKSSSTFVHSSTKFSFPKSVGIFQRVNIQKYDREEKDVGVGYNSSIPIAATVIVYPGAKDFAVLPSPKLENVSESLLAHHFETCKQDVFRAHADAKLIGESPYTLIQGNHRFEGKKAVFSMGYNFGFANQESVSELYVFLIEPGVKFLLTERFFVTYRVTYPINKKAQAEAEVETFMADLAWPTK